MSTSPDLAAVAPDRSTRPWVGLELLAAATTWVAIGFMLNNWLDAKPIWPSYADRQEPVTGGEILRWQVCAVVTGAAAVLALVSGIVRRRRLGGAVTWHLIVLGVGAVAVLVFSVTPDAPEPEPVDSPYGGVPCHSGSGDCGGGG